MVNIKIFSDFACPFCYIGFSIADRLRKENTNINIEWIPYILDSNVSLDGDDLLNHIPQEQIDMSYRRIERLGREYELVYNNKTKKFNTNRLHQAALYANKENKYYEFAKEAFKAIFEYGKNVGDPTIVNEIGLAAGLNIVEMNNCIEEGTFNDKIEEARNLVSVYEIESVPTFIVNDKKKVELLKDYEKFKKDLVA
ncbi:DsbA family protein [Tissierella sp. MB52-C2]|uniref:DsbA family oxidoreductase n=1 Tax=Tissierella sp. MB52-C2 TaxID=3070999 RepID=UPI00280AF441|nr:DsbA family protein [Tissierella sp. MB52-C2]WMM24732.1 DsbA family protein [Tissierella sp. MB52-C2]